LIHDAISNHGLKVDFKYAYTVLVYGCTKLTQGETNVELVAVDALEFSHTLLSNGKDFEFAIPEAQKVLLQDIFVTLLTKMRPLHAEMGKGANSFDAKYGNFSLMLKPEEIYERLMGAQEEDTMRLLVDQLVAARGMEVKKLLEQYSSSLQSVIEHTEELVAALRADH
jgi:hypothetical protein